MNIEELKKQSLIGKKCSRDLCRIEVWGDPDFTIRKGASQTFTGVVNIKKTPQELIKSINDKRIFLKAFPANMYRERMGYYDNSLQREVVILRYLSYFLKYRVTPCIQKYYADFTCPQKKNSIWDQKIMEEVFQNGNSAYHIDQENYEDFRSIHFVLSEYIEGKSLDSWLDKNVKKEDLASILFQILYTLWQFHLGGIRHNDLHFGNIIITKSSEKTLNFVVKDQLVTVSGNYIAKIIDYDRAGFYSGKPLENNLWNALCEQTGCCPDGIGRNNDPLRFLVYLHDARVLLSPENKQFIEEFLTKVSNDPDELFKNKESKYMKKFRGCSSKEGEDEKNWELPEETLMFFPEMLEKNVFNIKIQKYNASFEKDSLYISIDSEKTFQKFLEKERVKISE